MPYVFMTKDDHTQVDCALHIIEHLHNKGIDYKDIAVLARSSRETFRLENMLDVRGIPYDKYGGLKFLEYRCVQDAIALTRIATAGGPDVSWFRVLRLLPGIGNVYAKMILNARSGSTGIDFLKSQKWKKRKFAGELSLLHDVLAKASAMPFPGMLEYLADYYYGLRKRVVEQGVYENESNRSEALEILEDDKNTVSALMLLAQRYKSATDFLDSLVLDSLPKTPAQAKLQAEADGDEETDMLVVSTIHSVKGLEYYAVIILSCVDERLSFYGEGEMEALRCFYVAMTRAKDVLAMIVPLALQFKSNSIGAPSASTRTATSRGEEPVPAHIPAHISHFLPDRESGFYGIL
jgi:DNA helicase-2/ATP-dependent DNA helicase PcrA